MLCALVVLAVPAGTLSAAETKKPGKDRDFARPPGEDERLDRWREGEERRRAKRQSKDAKEERKRSKSRFRGQSKQQALDTARREQPVLIETPKHEPLELQAGERVERFHGEFGARINGPDGRLVVDSTLPLRSDVGGGPERLADYALEDRGSLLAPDNPIVATEISKDVRGGLRIGEFGIGLQTTSSATAAAVEDRAFFANALPDIDYVVLPTATGAHVSLQVRSAESPEQAVLALDLPHGARARLVEEEGAGGQGPGEGATLPRGSVEIVRAGEVIASILAPVAWGADGEALEVSYSLSGSDLVISFPHRSADVQYPLVVDPLVGDLFRVNEQGSPTSTSSFVIARSGGEPAAWTYGESAPGFPHGPGQGAGTYDHNNALWVSNLDRNRFYYGDRAYGQWTWQAPRQSHIKRADFKNVYFTPTSQPYPAAMCIAEGVYSTATWNWQSGYWIDANPNVANGVSPFIGGPAPNGSCNTKTNNGKAHWIDNPLPGNISVFQLFAYGAGYRYNYSDAALYGAAVYLEDNDVPSVTAATSSPGGWVRSGTVTTRVNATDPGLGVIVHAIDIPIEGSAPTGRKAQFTGACDRGRISRCPAGFDHTFSYNTEDVLPDDPNYPETMGAQRIREGVNTIEGDSYDALYKPTHFNAGTIKVDRTPPNGTISGIGEGELARDRDYTITGTSSDPLSGSRTVQITLDGVQKARRDNCPANGNPCALNWTLDGGDQALSEGTHTLRVVATDQVGNGPQTVATRTFRVERTKPTFEVDGSLLPTDTGWVATGDQDLIIDAFDDPSSVPASGATYVEARIDGNAIDQPVEMPCTAGGCELTADFVTNTDALAEGPHELTIVVRDGAGNTAEAEPIDFRVERSAPSLTVTGTLSEGQALEQGATHVLTATGMDGASPTMQSGLGAIDVAVDDEAPDTVEQQCEFGRCSMTRSFTYATDQYDPGEHTIAVTAADLAGNETTEQFTVVNPTPPEPECGPPAEPSSSSSSLPPLEPSVALQAFQLTLPEAFEEWSVKDFDGITIKPELDAADPAIFAATGVIAPMSVDKEASDGATTRVETDDVPICTTPTQVDAEAADPDGVENRTSVLYANSAPGVDTVIRPTAVGSVSILNVGDPQAPQSFTWSVDLQPGQELRELPNGGVAVVEPAPEESPIVTTGFEPPAVPSVDQRIDALSNTQLHFDQSTDALLRSLEQVPDYVVAVFPEPWARDALGRPVATSMTADGSGSMVTMTLASESLPPAAYPIVAGEEIVVGDSLDEWEVLESEADTADYTDAQLEGPQPTDEAPSEAPVDDIADEEGEFEDVGDPSAQQDPDLSDEADADDVEFAEPSAAGSRVPPLRASIALSESAPALLHNPRRLRLEPKHLRPIVPWRVTQMLKRPNSGPQSKPAVIAKEKNRAYLWDSRTDDGRPKGWFRIATHPSAGVRSPEEEGQEITSDVALQFVRVRINGKQTTTDPRPPRLVVYKRLLREFLSEYKSVMLGEGNRRVGTLTPWNEPQFPPNPTFKHPIAAARYWVAAEAICHPNSGRKLCGVVPAGEYAGYPKAQRIKFRGATRRWERVYEDYLLDPKRAHKPRAWGFHNYGDPNKYQRFTKRNGKKRFKWPITNRHYKRFGGDRYRYRDGAGDLKTPARWLTATGVFYHRNCGEPGTPFYQRNCARTGDDNLEVLFGMRNQRNTLNTMLRVIARDLEHLGRIYYYDLQDHKDAGSFSPPGPSAIPGRGAGRYDSGLIGSDRDGGDPRYEDRPRIARFPGARGFSNPNQLRLAFCAFERKVLTTGRPSKCQ